MYLKTVRIRENNFKTFIKMVNKATGILESKCKIHRTRNVTEESKKAFLYIGKFLQQ